MVADHLAAIVGALLHCAIGNRSDVGVVLWLTLAICFVFAEGALEVCGPERASSSFVVPTISSIGQSIRLSLKVRYLALLLLIAGGLVGSIKGLRYGGLWSLLHLCYYDLLRE